MNQTDSKIQIPENSVERFVLIVQSLLEPLGISKIPDIMNYVDLMIQESNRYLFDQDHPSSSKHKVHAERTKFIQIFKQRYLQLTDLEYIRPINPADAKMIGQIVKQLEDNGFKVEEYLQWVFETFLIENQKFCPPSIKFLCSGFALEKFMYENREIIKQRHDAEIRQKEMTGLILRARTYMHTVKAEGHFDLSEKVKELLSKYRDQVYNPMALREEMVILEKAYKARKEGTENGNGCSTNSVKCSEVL